MVAYKGKPKINNPTQDPRWGTPGSPIDTDQAMQTEGFFSNYNAPNIIKDLLEPGDDFKTAALRSHIPSQKKLLLAVKCWARYARYHQARHKEMLLSLFAGFRGVNGEAVIQAIMAATNIFGEDVALEMMGSTMNREGRQRLHKQVKQQEAAKAGNYNQGPDV